MRMGLFVAQSEMANRTSRDDIGKTMDHRYRIGPPAAHSSPGNSGKRRSVRLQVGRGKLKGVS
jgi:hypothetical protein